MRVFLWVSLSLFSLTMSVYGDQSQQQVYQEFVQVDAQIESLLKQKLQLKAELAQHREREETALRPRVDRRQNNQIEKLSQQIQALSQQLSQLEENRSLLLINLQ